MLSLERQKVTLAAIGKLDSAVAANTIGVANACQHSFWFSDLYEMPFKLKRYRLPNGGYDFDSAAEVFIKDAKLKGYPVLLTQDPYGGAATKDKPDEFYFTGELADDGGIVISTYLWSKLQPGEPIQDYILLMLGSALLAKTSGLHFHDETRGCLMDYCDDPADFVASFRTSGLCSACKDHVEKGVRAGQLTRAQYASCLKLVNRGRGTRRSFVVMPFRKPLDQIYQTTIRPALEQEGYQVSRGDELLWPRIITDAILTEILASNLIVADITGHNPNVFYEIGIADAIGVDLILLCQEGQTVPFDITQRRTLFYRPDNRKGLSEQLRKLCRTAGI
jgi:hypothetical protein